MRKLPVVFTILAAFQFVGVAQSKHPKSAIAPQEFLVDRSKPYVYLEVVRIGPRIPRNDDESMVGIWLRLHNNCIVPIEVRTFGVPPGSPDQEIGVLDDVVANPPLGVEVTADSWSPEMPSGLASVLGIPSSENPSKKPPLPMPSGYGGDVSSFETLAPGQSIYFSLPRNQVSPKWHVEIPFRFDLNVHSTLTSAHNFVALYEWDITSQVQNSKP